MKWLAILLINHHTPRRLDGRWITGKYRVAKSVYLLPATPDNMRFAVISIAVLTILKLNSPTPILEPHRVAKSDNVVVSFVDSYKSLGDRLTFPNRDKEIADAHQHDLNKEIAKEAARLQALEAQQKAQAVQTTTVAQNTPTVAPNDAKLYIYMHER